MQMQFINWSKRQRADNAVRMIFCSAEQIIIHQTQDKILYENGGQPILTDRVHLNNHRLQGPQLIMIDGINLEVYCKTEVLNEPLPEEVIAAIKEYLDLAKKHRIAKAATA